MADSSDSVLYAIGAFSAFLDPIEGDIYNKFRGLTFYGEALNRLQLLIQRVTNSTERNDEEIQTGIVTSLLMSIFAV